MCNYCNEEHFYWSPRAEFRCYGLAPERTDNFWIREDDPYLPDKKTVFVERLKTSPSEEKKNIAKRIREGHGHWSAFCPKCKKAWVFDPVDSEPLPLSEPWVGDDKMFEEYLDKGIF